MYCQKCGTKLILLGNNRISKPENLDKGAPIWQIASDQLKRDTDNLSSKHIEFYACIPCEQIFLSHTRHGWYLDIIGKLDKDLSAALLGLKIKE